MGNNFFLFVELFIAENLERAVKTCYYCVGSF